MEKTPIDAVGYAHYILLYHLIRLRDHETVAESDRRMQKTARPLVGEG